MQIPDALASLFDDGIIEEVVRPLMSGKEAQVFLVVSQGQVRVAKVYKDAQHRSFKNRAEYTEGRKTRNSRDQRAVDKRSKHGRAQDEAAWKSTEVDMIHRLHAGGVRVPTPYAFIDGVLVMECVVDAYGNPAPRLGDVAYTPEAAQIIYERVMREIVRMLAAGVVHGDLSDFNVLVAGDEPVIIDFPQSVDTAKNPNARRLLLRDVDNMHRFLQRHVPRAPRLPYAEEMWELHESNALTPDTRLTGRFRPTARRRSGGGDSVFELIQEAERDERKRREALGLRGGPRPSAPQPSGGAPSPRPGRDARPGQAHAGPRPGPRGQGQAGPNGSGPGPRRGGSESPSRGPQAPRGPEVYHRRPSSQEERDASARRPSPPQPAQEHAPHTSQPRGGRVIDVPPRRPHAAHRPAPGRPSSPAPLPREERGEPARPRERTRSD